MLNQSQREQSLPHSSTLIGKPWSVGVKSPSLNLAFWVLFQVDGFYKVNLDKLVNLINHCFFSSNK